MSVINNELDHCYVPGTSIVPGTGYEKIRSAGPGYGSGSGKIS
jgi:hypothetical protein